MVLTEEYDLLSEVAPELPLLLGWHYVGRDFAPEFLTLSIEWPNWKILEHSSVHLCVAEFVFDNVVHHHLDCVVQQDECKSQVRYVTALDESFRFLKLNNGALKTLHSLVFWHRNPKTAKYPQLRWSIVKDVRIKQGSARREEAVVRDSNDTNEPGGSQVFGELPAEVQRRLIAIGRQMTALARDHAVPIFFAPPRSIGGKINGASGCLLRLGAGTFLATASHVLAGYEERVRLGEVLNWQAGNLPPFDPISRIAWRDKKNDIVVLRLSDEQAQRIGPCTISTPKSWPIRPPQEGEMVLVAGYPRALREEYPSAGWIGSGAYSAAFPVTKSGVGYCICQIDHKDLVSFDGRPLPEPEAELGGLSGGPVLLVSTISYPLVGLITQRLQMDSTEFLKFATFETVMIKDDALPAPTN